MRKTAQPAKAKAEASLTPRDIARAALKLMNKVGMDGLTTRRLAQALGVKGPALYWHFPNMDALYTCMAEILMEKALHAVKTEGKWNEWLQAFAREIRRQLLRQRDGARLIATASPTEQSRTEAFPLTYQALIDAGFTRDNAVHAVSVVLAYTLGWSAYEQGGSGSFMNELMNVDATFEFGLGLIVGGVKRELKAR